MKFKGQSHRGGILMKPDYITAHKYSANHKATLQKDKICGCFYCLKVFNPQEITEWILDKEGTAMCPYCSIDSILGESSGYPITVDFLSLMHKYWF